MDYLYQDFQKKSRLTRSSLSTEQWVRAHPDAEQSDNEDGTQPIKKDQNNNNVTESALSRGCGGSKLISHTEVLVEEVSSQGTQPANVDQANNSAESAQDGGCGGSKLISHTEVLAEEASSQSTLTFCTETETDGDASDLPSELDAYEDGVSTIQFSSAEDPTTDDEEEKLQSDRDAGATPCQDEPVEFIADKENTPPPPLHRYAVEDDDDL